MQTFRSTLVHSFHPSALNFLPSHPHNGFKMCLSFVINTSGVKTKIKSIINLFHAMLTISLVRSHHRMFEVILKFDAFEDSLLWITFNSRSVSIYLGGEFSTKWSYKKDLTIYFFLSMKILNTYLLNIHKRKFLLRIENLPSSVNNKIQTFTVTSFWFIDKHFVLKLCV